MYHRDHLLIFPPFICLFILKLYMEDGLLMRTSASNSSLRARTKLEVLDNLVISTIHGLSTKIRTNAETLLRKLRYQSKKLMHAYS